MRVQCRLFILVCVLAALGGCNQAPSEGVDAPAGLPAKSAGPSAGMKWAATKDFRGEVPTSWTVVPGAMPPMAVMSSSVLQSGLMLGIFREDRQAHPLPISFSVTLVTPSNPQISIQYLVDSLHEVSRRFQVQADEAIQVAGHPATRIITLSPDGKMTTHNVVLPTTEGVLVITAMLLPNDDYQFIKADMDRFVGSLQLLP